MSIKVKLRHDLTSYHPGLIAGVEGYTEGRHDCLFGNGTTVTFPSISRTQQVLINSLVIIDLDEYTAIQKKIKEDENAYYLKGLEYVKEAVLTVGPRGGFRNLSIRYTDGNPLHLGSTGIGFSSIGNVVLGKMRDLGVPYKTVVEK